MSWTFVFCPLWIAWLWCLPVFVFSCLLINLYKFFILNINHMFVFVSHNNNPAICLCCVTDTFNHINIVKISFCVGEAYTNALMRAMYVGCVCRCVHVHVESIVQSQVQFLRNNNSLGKKKNQPLVRACTPPAWVTEGNSISLLTTYWAGLKKVLD